jgi:hypothetical protein
MPTQLGKVVVDVVLRRRVGGRSGETKAAVLVALVAALGAVGCTPAATVPGSSAPLPVTQEPLTCPTSDQVEVAGIVANPEITEASGVAASGRSPGVYWVHNDSGDRARVFAMTTSGADLGSFDVAGATATDWEDLAIAPGPGGVSHLYIGDIGGNGGRATVTVHRVAEPAVDPGAPAAATALQGVVSFSGTYPGGGRYDAEAMFADPVTGGLYIVTKSAAGASRIFLLPAAAQVPGGAAPLVEVGSRQFSEGNLAVTGGDMAPDGSEIVLRTYDRVYLWHRASGRSVAEALAGVPCVLRVSGEPQGEAVGFQQDGRSLVLATEGVNQLLREVRR